MSAIGRPATLRARLILLGALSILYVIVVTVQLGSVLVPAATAMEGRARDQLSEHDRIAGDLKRMTEARREVARWVPPIRDTVGRESLAAIRTEMDRLLAEGVAMRGALERADVPLEMRVLLAEALEQETALGVHVVEAIRAVQLGRPADGVEPLRASGLRSDSSARLLSLAQRRALAIAVDEQGTLLRDLERLERWASLWVVVGLVLFAWGVWMLRDQLLRPLAAIEGAVRRIRDGDLDTVLAVPRADELGRLADLVNDMRAMLRARAEDETARREGLTERFGRILDESSNEIGIFDARSLRALQLNRGARAHLGYAPEEVAALSLPQLLRAIDVGVLHELVARLRTGQQERLILTTRQTRKDGSDYPVELTVRLSRDRDAELLIIVGEDAGARERVRELDRALREHSYREQQRLEREPVGATLASIASMAAQALQVPQVGIWREKGGAHHCIGTSGPPGPELAARALPDAPWHLTVTVPATARGDLLLVAEAPAPDRVWSAEERTFLRAVGALAARAVDADERRALEQALARAQRMDSIGQLAGGIAHDFNNILTAILGNLEIARSGLDPNDGRAGAIADAEEAARRAADLTRQLLTFARHQRVEQRVIDLNALTRDADRMLRRLVGPEVEIDTRLDPALRAVRAAPGQIEQVLLNLVVNARDATPRGGRISIATRNRLVAGTPGDGAGDVPPGDYVELSVRDTGSGMPADVLERVFEPFFTTKEPGAGTGLGLAVCYGIVRQAGGDIVVQSAPGEGTVFRVLLPAVDAPVEPLDRAPAPGQARGSETILVAEDEPAIRTLVARALGARGYRVLHAADGQQALDVAAGLAEAPHLLLTDVVMPRLGGPELAVALRHRWPTLPVLLMSGYTADALREGREVPESAFLVKPFTADQLSLRVREVLDGRYRRETPRPGATRAIPG